jgi:hypothetical protein
MRQTTIRTLGVCAALAMAASTALLAGQDAPDISLDQVLKLAGRYVEQYEHAMAAVVAREDYQQSVLADARHLSGASSRTLRSDVLVFDAGPRGWVSFRDVYEVDGSSVRDHDQRLTDLVSHFTPDSLQEIRRIAAESARFNLNPPSMVINRNINTPMTALLFLRDASQARSTFTLGKSEQVGDVRAVQVTFVEQAKPRLIASGDDAAARGTFWIDPANGRVVRTQLDMTTELRGQSVTTRIVVTYGKVANIEVWVPVTMDETYDMLQMLQTIKGHATYSHFRQFSVTVNEEGNRAQ